MRASTVLILALLAAGGAWYGLQHYKFRGLEKVALVPREGAADGDQREIPAGQSGHDVETLTIGSVWLAKELGSDAAGAVVKRALGQAQLLCVQTPRPANSTELDALLARLNQEQERFAVVAPAVSAGQPGNCLFVMIFDRQRLEYDPDTVAAIDDPTGSLLAWPLVTAFRARGPAEADAWTFTLLAMAASDPRELERLPPLWRATRRDGRNEDDLLLAANLSVPLDATDVLVQLGKVQFVPAPVDGSRPDLVQSHLAWDPRATVEAVGGKGELGPGADFDSTAAERSALAASPVFARFRIREGD